MIRLERTRGVRALQAVLVATFLLGAGGEAFAQSAPPAPAPASKAPSKKDDKDKKKEQEKAAQTTETETAAAGAKTDAKAPDEATPKEEKEASRAIYVSADIGFTRPDIGGISNSLSFDRTAANGVTGSVGAGLRLKDIKLGARWRVFDTTEFDFWAFMLEAGYSLPMRPVSPGIVAHVGYMYDQKLNRSLFRSSIPGDRQTVLDPDVDVHGAIVGAELQAMYWVSRYVRAGGFLGFDFLFLNRPEAGLPGSTFPIPDDIRQKPLYTESGSSVGFLFNVGIRGAFDVGF